MYKFFGSVNEEDSQNKSLQSDIALEKFWVAQCSWLRLYTNVSMGMTITNCWKLFRYGVKRDHYNKFIGNREFLELITVDCFNNNFTTDAETPAKNIPLLDDIDNGGTVYTCRRLNYSSSSPRYSEISTISDITIATAPNTYIGHAYLKGVELDGGRYIRAVSGYFHRRLPNGNICLKRSIWYCNGCSIWLGRRTYYCTQNSRGCFASHHDSLVFLP